MTKKDKFLGAAQKFLERGSLDKALAEFQRAAQEDPKDTRTWLRIAEINVKRGENAEAVQVYLKTADLYVEQGFFQRAVAVYKNVIKLAPSYVEAHFKLADIFKQLGLFSDAVQQYEQAAVVYQKAGRLKEAMAALTQIVELNPDQVLSRIKLAELASQAGRVDEAIREFGRAADQLEAQGKVDEYLRVAERLLYHQPQNLALAKKVARRYIERQNARFALAKLQECFNADPKDAETLDMLATAFEQLGQVQKTVSVLRELAKVHAETGRIPERNLTLQRILALDPEDAEARQFSERASQVGAAPRFTAPRTAVGVGPQLPAISGGAAARAGAAAEPRAGGKRITFTMSAAPDEVAHTTTFERFADPKTDADRVAFVERAVPSEADADAETQRIVNEADVFVKYGLVERAADHLRKVFEHDPGNVPARERLVAVLQQLGRPSEAARELEALAEALLASKPTEAGAHARRAIELDPASDRARRVLEAAARPARAAEPVVADEIEELDIDAVPELVLEDSSDNVPQPLDPQDSTGYADVELLGARAPAARAHEPGPVPEIDDSLLPPADDAGGDDGSDDITTDDAPPAALLGDLEQVDFFIDQGLLEDATAMLDEIDPTYARHAAVLERRQRVANARATEHGPEPSATALDLETPDFESATPAPVRRTPVPEPRPAEATPTAPVGGGAPDPAAVVSPRVIVAGGAADLGTHADLGIAYKEMGLHDAAIKEFGLLAQDPSREVFALTMIGDCYEARGAPAEALVHYKKALNRPGVRDDEAMQLYYKLGRVFQALGDRDEALYFFEKVLKRDARFEDVEQRVSSLRGAPPGGARRS